MLLRALASCSRYRCTAPWPWTGISRYSTSKGPNEYILAQLEAEYRREKNNSEPNHYKMRAWSNAITQVLELGRPIQNASDLRSLNGVGLRIAKKIMEYVSSADPANIELASEANRVVVLEALQSLPGIGKQRAKQLYEAGCRGIKDISKREYFTLLTKSQQARIRHMEDFSQPARVEEVMLLTECIQQTLPADWEVIPTSSIRRGATYDPTGINLLLIHRESGHIPPPPAPYSDSKAVGTSKRITYSTNSSFSKRNGPLKTVIIPSLDESGILVDVTTATHTVWSGLVRIPKKLDDGQFEWVSPRKEGIREHTGTFRKARLVAAPLKSRGAILLAETGDLKLWKNMCARALSLGMFLTPSGLWKWRTDNSSIATNPSNGYWELLQSSTEEEIFEQIGMEYLEPSRRNMSFIS